jgi:hypothetical protein
MISRTFASVFPRQSPSCLIFSSMNAEAGFWFISWFSLIAQVSAVSRQLSKDKTKRDRKTQRREKRRGFQQI